MTIQNKLKLISLLPIMIMIGLAGYLLWDVYLKFNINDQNQLILIGVFGSIILLGLILLIYGYSTSSRELKNISELNELFDDASEDIKSYQTNVSNLKLDTYEGIDPAYAKVKKFVDSAKKDKIIALEANRAKYSLLLANISHEIRMPLNVIVGFAELIKSTDTNEEQQEFISIIEKGSENILTTINNIYDLSKIESNKIDIENIIFDTLEEFEGIIETYALNAAEKNINLNFYINPRISPKLKGDPDKIKEIMNNLLSNAIKFTNSHGDINVEVSKINEVFHENIVTSTLLIKVQDNGVGMTKEQLEHIFEAFSQTNISATRKYEGMGLGLTISSQFAQIMGGNMEVESIRGIGTTFYLTLPIEEVTIENYNLEDAYSDIMIGLYESDHIPSKLANYIKKYFKFFGIKVKTFKSINKLNSLSQKHKCKFCLIDIDKAEPEIIEALAEADKTKLIVMSQPANKDKLQQLGLSDQNILLKPITLSKIKDILSNKMEDIVADDISPTSLDAENFMGDILIAKTNDLENKIVAKMAQNMGYTTIISNDFELLSEALEKGKFDIVIADEETIEKLNTVINDNVDVITKNVIEELKSRNEKTSKRIF